MMKRFVSADQKYSWYNDEKYVLEGKEIVRKTSYVPPKVEEPKLDFKGKSFTKLHLKK